MIDAVLPLLLENERFVLVTHLRPDGDAIGSQLALARFLEKLGKRVDVMNSDAPPYNLSWMPGADDLAVYKGEVRQVERLAEADVIVVLDTNTEERLGRVGASVRHSRAHRVLIDHHTAPEGWFDHVYRRETASSTGELVYELIAAHDPSLIDTEIATALYAAIMTDTGSFRFSNVTAHVHYVIADLIERGGLRVNEIHAAVYDTRSTAGLRLMSRTFDTLTLLYQGQIGYIVVPQAVLRETGADVTETEGFVNEVLSIEGVKAAMIFTETEKGTKVSFRSKGDVHVHQWAQSLGGGGHRNASGAFLNRTLEDTIDLVVSTAPRFIALGHDEEEENANGQLSPEDEAYHALLIDMKSRKTAL